MGSGADGEWGYGEWGTSLVDNGTNGNWLMGYGGMADGQLQLMIMLLLQLQLLLLLLLLLLLQLL